MSPASLLTDKIHRCGHAPSGRCLGLQSLSGPYPDPMANPSVQGRTGVARGSRYEPMKETARACVGSVSSVSTHRFQRTACAITSGGNLKSPEP
ncbi:hypothetical protein FMEAI12_4280068 [Parafrankia sp. Ea1.12]|nr:hypothetical protein FMEAI12_4280068 [Parafrankia sp. Ea1.12]